MRFPSGVESFSLNLGIRLRGRIPAQSAGPLLCPAASQFFDSLRRG